MTHTCELCATIDSGKPAEKVCTCEPAIGASDAGHGKECPLYTVPEMSAELKALIVMVDALPNGADITEENKEATKIEIEVAHTAYTALSNKDKAAFEASEQYKKLMELTEMMKNREVELEVPEAL